MSYDVLIKNGLILDGTGNPWYKSDLGIQNGKVETISKNLLNADIVIDASDLVVAPGFIDMHSHADMTIPFLPRQDSMVRQGITTAVIGNCGFSLAPVKEESVHILEGEVNVFTPPGEKINFTWRSFDEYLSNLDGLGCALNVVPLVGFGTIRITGGPAFENRKPTQDEFSQMRAYVDEAMNSGAFGLSTGLIYSPQIYAQTQEVIEIAKVVATYQGLYFSHIRNESSNVINAIKEFIKIVRESGCIGGQIAHHKVSGRDNWGKSIETLKLIEKANLEGLNVTSDQYPYNRGMTSLKTVLPPWVHIGGRDRILEHLASKESREKIKADILENKSKVEGYENWIKNIGFSNIYISSVRSNKWKDCEGKNFSEITESKMLSDPYELLFDMLLEEQAEITMTIETMGIEDINRIMRSPYTMFGTDGWGVSPSGPMSYGKPHPRFYGSFPRILGKMVREQNLLSIEEAIRKMTSFPAKKLGLTDRGLLRKDFWADIVIFDSDSIADLATFSDPHKFPRGVKYVLINGDIVVNNEELVDKLPGKVIRRKNSSIQ